MGHFLGANKGKIIFGFLIAAGGVVKANYDSKGNGVGNSGDPDSGSSSCCSDYSLDSDDDFGSFSDDNNFSVDERDYPDERQSPREHDVSGYTRYCNGKEIHVSPYKRVGKKDE